MRSMMGRVEAITAKEAWDLASARAHAWQADAVPFDLTTTSSGVEALLLVKDGGIARDLIFTP